MPCKGWADGTYNGASGLVLTYTEASDGITITKMTTAPTDGNVVIPSKIGTKTVVAIGEEAFRQKETISAVEIPASVKNIADFAFSNCTSLASISFADESELTSIGQMAFSGGSYTKVTIPKKVTRIGQQAFDFNTNLLEITFLNSTPCALDGSLFTGELAAGFKIYVPTEAVNAYKSASNYYWGQLAEYIQEIPSAPQPGDVITDDTFKYTVNEDGNSVTLTGFKDADTAPTSITIPAIVQGFDVTSIGEEAFSNRSNLTSVQFAENSKLVTISDQAFAESGITSIAIPASVQEIGQEAFAICESLSTVTFAENASLKKIGAGAFGITAIEEITIPASVETIVGAAFAQCEKLDKVTMLGSTPCALEPFENEGETYKVFDGCPLKNKIHVPEDAISDYKNDTEKGWADYKDYIYEPSAAIVDGDYTYELNADGENTVTLVKFTATDSWSENVNVPATFEKDGTTYTVTQIGKGEKINVSVYYRSAMVNAIPNTVTKIGAYAFDHIRFANGVIIPASVNSIGDAAFVSVSDDNSTTTSVYSVTLKASEAFTVGEKIFGETSNLLKEHFSILTSSEEVANKFKQTSGWDTYKDYFITEIVKNGLRYRKNGDGTALTLMGFDGDAQSSLTVPAEVDGIPVTAISSKAFMAKSNLVSLDLSQAINLTQIGESAFGATGLTEVVIPAQVKTLGYRAFGDIYSLTQVTFERESDFGVSVNYSYAFGGSDNLAEIYVPKGTKGDYTNLFRNSIGNAENKIKEIVKPISDGIYKYQLNDDGRTVTVVGIADGVTLKNEIWVFGNVGSYEVTGIAANAFSNMPEITQLHIPSCVSTIAANAFTGMKTGLKVYFERTGDISEYSKEMFGNTVVSSISVPTEAYAAYYAQLTNDQEDQNKIEKPAYTLEITDNGEDGVTTEMEGKTYEAGKITYKRTFSQAGQYGTIALPFSVASSEWNEYFDAVYTVSGAESMGNGLSKLKFQEVDKNASLNAKDAYFVKLKDGVQDVTLTNADATEIVAQADSRCNQVSFDDVVITTYANWQKKENSDVTYYTFNADGTFGQSDYVYPFRMYLTIARSGGDFIVGAPAFFSIELPNGSTTGIHGVSAESAGSKSAIYSIDGKMVRADGNTQGLAKGIYVKNGKKMVIK